MQHNGHLLQIADAEAPSMLYRIVQ